MMKKRLLELTGHELMDVTEVVVLTKVAVT